MLRNDIEQKNSKWEQVCIGRVKERISRWTKNKEKEKTEFNWKYLGVVWESVLEIPSETK